MQYNNIILCFAKSKMVNTYFFIVYYGDIHGYDVYSKCRRI